ncbi:MAG: alpha/beta hydrolase [Hungatella sp.]|nr:alpha/beta hydrolase [Hungatella sp.]
MGLREQVIRQWEDHEARDAARKAGQSPPAGVTGIRDLEYLPSGRWQHRLDVFRPEGEAGVLPVIVDIHGGGWMYGNKELNEYYCMDLAARGFVVIDLNYTLVPDTDLRGQIRDIAEALNWCFDHGGEYGYDGRRLCVTGDSAGGHLAFLICAIADSLEYQRRYRVLPLKGEIRALGLVCPASLKDMESDPDPLRRQRCRMIYGMEPTISPLWNCSGWEDVVGVCKLPPVFLLTTEEDRIHYPQARRLHRLLAEHQADHLFVQWPPSEDRALGHVFNVLHHEYPESSKANQKMIDFFVEKTKGAVT